MNCFICNSTIRPRLAYQPLCRGFKMKKVRGTPTIPPTRRALEHFDVYYKPNFKELWPSMRLAMLTTKKGAAVMNNFSDSSVLQEKLLQSGARDIIQIARDHQMVEDRTQNDEKHKLDVQDVIGSTPADSNVDTQLDDSDKHTEFQRDDENILLDNFSNKIDRKDLDAFMPVRKVYSDAQLRAMEEIKQSVYTPLDMKIDIVKPPVLSIPERLQVYCFPSGNNSPFTKPKVDRQSGFLTSFLFSASSVLPVLALDLQEGDDVLDLCAAPGGKTLCMLQTRLPGSITCNDSSKSRLHRLHRIMEFYVPKEDRQHVNVVRGSGENMDGQFDKILVDVPCNTDRQRLLDDFNNLYNPARTGERLALPELQKNLLMSAIRCCRVGGSVVYSTCTLAAAQNDGTVQNALDEILQTTDIRVVIEDLSEIKRLFQDTFTFYDSCRLGQLVIPSIRANFGPMYFCKIKRIN